MIFFPRVLSTPMGTIFIVDMKKHQRPKITYVQIQKRK
jgi:hypothetical protein